MSVFHLGFDDSRNSLSLLSVSIKQPRSSRPLFHRLVEFPHFVVQTSLISSTSFDTDPGLLMVEVGYLFEIISAQSRPTTRTDTSA